MPGLSTLFLLVLFVQQCFPFYVTPRTPPPPPPYQHIPFNTLHAMYYDATRQAYVQHAFAVMKVMVAEWKKAFEKVLLLPFTTFMKR